MYIELLKNKKRVENFQENGGDSIVKHSNRNIGNKKLKKKSVFYIYITTSMRGFYVNILDDKGAVLKHFTAGKFGYKKALRYNIISLRTFSNHVYYFFNDLKLKPKDLRIFILLKGFNIRRNSFIRSVIRSLSKFRRCVVSITDMTDLPYNGCRPKKLRRK